MRYGRNFKRFLIPSILFHALILILGLYLYRTNFSNNKTGPYEIGLIRLESTKQDKNNSPITSNRNEQDSVKDRQNKNLAIAKSNTVTKIKSENDIPKYIMDNTNQVMKDGDNQSLTLHNSATKSAAIYASTNNISRTAYPDYKLNPKPEYPILARRRGYEGISLVAVKVLGNGMVGMADIEKSSGYAILDKTALKAVRGWIFVPAMKDGVPVSSWVTVPIKFALKD